MAHKHTGKKAQWDCVQYAIGRGKQPCTCWLLHTRSHTAMIEGLFRPASHWAVGDRLPVTGRAEVATALWLTQGPPGAIGRGRARSFAMAREAVNAWITGQRSGEQSISTPAPIEEGQITLGDC